MAKKNTYHAASVPVVEGQAHGIEVCLRNYPVREANDGSGRRVECFPDFNVFLLDAIWEEISEYDRFIVDVCGSPVQFYLKIKDCSPILFEIRVAGKKSKRQFKTEMPDALIDAFRHSSIDR